MEFKNYKTLKNMFKNVIVRTPNKSICEGITSVPELGKSNYEKALEQHKKYGVEVEVLEPLDEFPDSCFVEDVAVLTKNCTIITNTGASSRNKEKEEYTVEPKMKVMLLIVSG